MSARSAGADARNDEPTVTDSSCWVESGDPVAEFLRARLGWEWQHLAVISFLVYGPIEKLVIPALGGYINFSGPATSWVPDVEAILLGFVVFPSFFAFYLWSSRGMVDTFDNLERNQNFSDQARFAVIMRQARAAYARRRWTFVGIAGAIGTMLAVHFVLWGPGAVVPPWFGAENTPHRILALVLIGFIGYAITQVFIREALTAIWLRRLFIELRDDLVVRPYHADGVGGFGAIGQHAMNLALLFIALAVFIGLGSILPGLRGIDTLGVTFWSPLIVVMWVLYLIFVPLAFGLLIWAPHRAMCRARDRQVNVVSAQLDKRLAAAEASVTGDLSKLPEIVSEMDRLKAMRALLIKDYPIWPVSETTRQQVRLSALLPFAQSLLPLLLGQLGLLSG
jgi:hypothetical protein